LKELKDQLRGQALVKGCGEIDNERLGKLLGVMHPRKLKPTTRLKAQLIALIMLAKDGKLEIYEKELGNQ
jgi:hypothetical protein